MTKETEELLDRVQDWFTYHKPTEKQVGRMKLIRQLGHELASEIALIEGMEVSDKMAAIRKVREAVMTANAGMVCGKEKKNKLAGGLEKLEEALRKAPPESWYPGKVFPQIPDDWSQPAPGWVCPGCSGPQWIAGPWVCPVCGRHYPGGGATTTWKWKSDSTGYTENID